MNVLVESVAQHPYAALGIAAWSIWVLNILKECVALLATRQRPPAPPPIDWDDFRRRQNSLFRARTEMWMPPESESTAEEEEEVSAGKFESSRVRNLN